MNSKNNSSISKEEPIFPCKLCPKNVIDNDNKILCDLCQTWVHIKCSDPENVFQSKYYDKDELRKLKIPNKDNSLSLFHINSCSLNKNFEELQNILQAKNIDFDVIAIIGTAISFIIS